MKEGTEINIINRLQQRIAILRLTEVIFWSLACACLVTGIANIFAPFALWMAVAGLIAATVAFIIIRRSLNYQPTKKQIARFLDYTFPELENSSDLLLTDIAELNGLQRLQRNRLQTALQGMPNHLKIRHRIPLAIIVCAATLGLFAFDLSHPSVIQGISKSQHNVDGTTRPVPGIKSASITIAPPSYTGLKPYTTTTFPLTVPEGSKIEWQISFTDLVRTACIIVGNTDTITLKNTGHIHVASLNSTRPSFYQISWGKDTLEKTSEFFKLDVRSDASPEINITGINQFTELKYGDRITVSVSAEMSDDYGLTEAYIIATVSKGSGESVKFREEKLSFDRPTLIQGRKVNAGKQLNLKTLGLDPGDELYFYVMAFDNRSPLRNYSRSQTYFIALQDTTQVELSVDAGIGVDLMPEYFRSQRQIIIDTEKLLSQQKSITTKEFKSKSNELAHDQKVLRLRYGQFLGEEFESGMVGEEDHTADADHHHDEEDDGDDVTKKFGHVHDNEQSGEHELPAQHNHAEKDPEEKEDPLERFVHRHDDPEEATFFTQTIRAKLKATLTIMWDAELHLRLGEPRKSLPFQYKALKLLKEIANDSRIYVHRTGFDAPPIKEEKRLTGELDDARTTTDRYSGDVNIFPALHEALAVAEKLIRTPNSAISNSDIAIFNRAAAEAGRAAPENPLKFIPLLSALQKFTAGTADSTNLTHQATKLSAEIRNVLPGRSPAASAQAGTYHSLDSLFIHNLFRP